MPRQFTQGTCSAPGCTHFGRITRGLCDTDYSRLIRTSGPLPRRSLAERFWPKVNKDGPVPAHRPELGPCWLWTASRGTSGYGQISRGRQGEGLLGAHVASWIIAYGPVPAGMWVLHKCDVQLCVRPDHLFLGTVVDNNADMTAKGRNGFLVKPERLARGERSSHAKLTADQVAEIRRLYDTGIYFQKDLAALFGVGQTTVGRVLLRQTWSHVT